MTPVYICNVVLTKESVAWARWQRLFGVQSSLSQEAETGNLLVLSAVLE